MFGRVTAVEDKSETFAPITLNAIFDAYLAERRNEFSDTPCKHPDALADHLKPVRAVWGDLTIMEFSLGSKKRVRDQVETWRRDCGWSVGTCRKRIATFKAALNYAHGEELIDRVPVFKMPPSGSPRQRLLDPVKELGPLLVEADSPRTAPHIRLCINLSLRTGQRQSAIRDLKWAQVDFENRVIRFSETEAPSERSKKRRTDQPMNDALYAIMREAKSNATTDSVLEYNGRPVHSTFAGVKACFARAGISNLTRHDLRRAAATYVSHAAGGAIRPAADLLGDTDAVAKDSYVVDDPNTRLPQIETLSAMFDKARKSG